MEEPVLGRARAGDAQAFRALTDPYRRELQVHCYRILGSVTDAEDVLQDTLLAAWRGLDGFQGRASLRTWLYRIATNRCLNALRAAGRRVPPAPTAPFEPPEPTRWSEATWLEPYPDAMLDGIADDAPGPDSRYSAQEAVELAFVESLQHLPPRQAAVLILRDVLGFPAVEVAAMLDTSPVAVKGALQRARATLRHRRPASGAERPPPAGSTRERALVRRFAEAFTADDVDGVVALLTDDAWLAMPPAPHEYHGAAAIAAFLSASATARAGRCFRLAPSRANTQPAFLSYLPAADRSAPRPAGLLVLTLSGDHIGGVTHFLDSAVHRYFDSGADLHEIPG